MRKLPTAGRCREHVSSAQGLPGMPFNCCAQTRREPLEGSVGNEGPEGRAGNDPFFSFHSYPRWGKWSASLYTQGRRAPALSPARDGPCSALGFCHQWLLPGPHSRPEGCPRGEVWTVCLCRQGVYPHACEQRPYRIQGWDRARVRGGGPGRPGPGLESGQLFPRLLDWNHAFQVAVKICLSR